MIRIRQMDRSLARYSMLVALSFFMRPDCCYSFSLVSSHPSFDQQQTISDAPLNRRNFLVSSIGTVALIGAKRPAIASYGDSSNLELPNYIEFLMKKNAVVDPSSFLYSGPDPKVQLQRLLDASKRLEDIPLLAADKKWSQVQGILTGPLGTLAQTLNLIAKDSTPEVQAKAKKVKETIFSISTAAVKKSQSEVIAQSKAAAVELEAFVRAAF